MKHQLTRKSIIFSLVIAIGCLVFPIQQAVAHAGKVLFVSGKVTVKSRRHNNTVLRRGSSVWPGDIVFTGKDSSAQIRAGDGTFISLKAKSKFVIEAHKHTGPVEKQHSSLELVKGGMRAVTGLIGKNKPDNFRIKARGSTIGVRGTEFVVQICDSEDCNQSKASAKSSAKGSADTGVYVGVVAGAITVEKNDKEVELDASLNVVLGVNQGIAKDKFQYVFIDDKKEKEAPKVLKEAPKVLVVAMAPPAPVLSKKKDEQPKPRHNLSPFEGLDVKQLQIHLASTAPIEKARSPLEDFENLDYPQQPNALTPHREIRPGYEGVNINDGQRYNLSDGFPSPSYY